MKTFNKKQAGKEEYTVALALVDALPVLCFGISAVLLGMVFQSALFITGAVLCVLAGTGKVFWKLLLAVRRRDVAVLNRQFRFLMSGGFLLILLALLVNRGRISLSVVRENITAFPGCILFGVGAAGLCLMGVLAIVLDKSIKANWIEQVINLVAQLSILMGVLLVWYASDYYRAAPEVKEAFAAADGISVVSLEDGVFFDGPGEERALIFYPGAKVEYTAYAPLMRQLAEAGTDCFLLKMPYHMAIFGMNRGDEIQASYEYSQWYIGGHSLGGAMAASYVSKRLEKYQGLVLLAAYPTKPLKRDGFSVVSVYGSEDQVLDLQKLEEGRQYMPTDYREVCINGGNHAWFGNYGKQAGDGKATVSHEEQWRQTVEALWK